MSIMNVGGVSRVLSKGGGGFHLKLSSFHLQKIPTVVQITIIIAKALYLNVKINLE